MSSRQPLLETAFSDLRSRIGPLELRPLSAGSFTLLARLGNVMVTNAGKLPSEDSTAEDDKTAMFEAVIQYVYIHSAPLEKIVSIETAEDIDPLELKKLSFDISMREVFEFLGAFAESATRMAGNLAEIEPDDEDGKPGKPEPLPVGSQASSTPAGPAVIPSGSDTSSGSCLLKGPLPISTPPTSPTEPAAGGPVMLPDLTTEPTTRSVSSPPYNRGI